MVSLLEGGENMQGQLFVITLTIGASLALFLAAAVSRRGSGLGNQYFAFLNLAIAWWSILGLVEHFAPNMDRKVLVSSLQYAGIVAAPVFWLTFCIAYTRQEHWISPKKLVSLWILPFITVCLAVTNRWHHLLWSQVSLKIVDGVAIGIYSPGPWSIVNLVWSYGLMIAGVVLVLHSAIRTNAPYKKQACGLALAIFPPWITNCIYFSYPEFFNGFDLTPASFVLSSLLMWINIRQNHLFLLNPVTPSQIIQSLDFGLITLDPENHVTEGNQEAFRLLGLNGDHLGRNLDALLSEWPDILNQLMAGQTDFDVRGLTVHWLRIRRMELRSLPEIRLGHLLSIEDITERKQLEAELRRMAATDMLTGLVNRRAFMERAQEEVIRTHRYRHPLSILMMDLDHFKLINDNYGHHAGDMALIEFSKIVKMVLRDTDIFARIGGEEFAILLPATPLKAAEAMAGRVLDVVRGIEIHLEAGMFIRFTVSIGVSAVDSESVKIDNLINRGDLALYRAKVNGRNRAELYVQDDKDRHP